jgi:hypothetical protein
MPEYWKQFMATSFHILTYSTLVIVYRLIQRYKNRAAGTSYESVFLSLVQRYTVFIVQACQTSWYVVPRGGIFLGKWHSSFAGSSDNECPISLLSEHPLYEHDFTRCSICLVVMLYSFSHWSAKDCNKHWSHWEFLGSMSVETPTILAEVLYCGGTRIPMFHWGILP